jgi:hypothetical protein
MTTYPVLDPARTEADTAFITIPRVLDNPLAVRVVLHHGLDSTEVQVRSFTDDGAPRGLAYVRVVDPDHVEVTVADDAAYVEVSR